MSVSAAHRLTNETLSLVLACLPLHDLTSASLVSKAWQAVVFPHLYRTVCVSFARHLKELGERVALDEDGPLSLRTHVRGLIFDKYYRKFRSSAGKPVAEEDLEDLVALLPALSQLEHFAWEMPYAPRNTEVLETLQATPSLKSIHWMVNEDEKDMLAESFDDYVKLLEFKNLSRFGLTIMQIPPDFDEDNTEPLVNLIGACPDLQSLNLDFQDLDGERSTWSPDTLLGQLDSHTFTSLHTFRALGKSTPNWTDFFESPDSSPLRTFLSRHPKLHTLGLGWVNECTYDEEVDPDEMAALLPSLKHLEAPTFVCAPVLASSLADQLESVAVMDEFYDEEPPNLQTIAEGITSLPKLRKFSLRAESDTEIETAPLKTILSMAPLLEEFEIRVPLDEPDQLLEVLKLIPNLRVLGTYEYALNALQEELGVSQWEECIPTLAQNCPQLRCIHYLSGSYDNPYWLIKREADGQVSYVQSPTQ